MPRAAVPKRVRTLAAAPSNSRKRVCNERNPYRPTPKEKADAGLGSKNQAPLQQAQVSARKGLRNHGSGLRQAFSHPSSVPLQPEEFLTRALTPADVLQSKHEARLD